MIKHLDTIQENFDHLFEQLLTYSDFTNTSLEKDVKDIITRVQNEKDSALFEYTHRFDSFSPSSLKISDEAILSSCDKIEKDLLDALTNAAQRIKKYHQHQVQTDWMFQDELGVQLGQKITPIDSVGLYVPGGKAAYPSTVLMNAIPALVAGVGRIAIATPCPNGILNQAVLAAAYICGIKDIYCVGGAQAIAALAFGTETITPVDKIVGPGNAYVAEAKRQVYGKVGIDMIAGPSEITIIADGSMPAKWTAIDMFSQAEHDELAQAILLCHDEQYIEEVQKQITLLLPEMSRQSIIAQSLKNRGALIKTSDLDESLALSNQIAPEHLQLAIENPESALTHIKHAGAIFLGHYTPEVYGDYCAGSNHVLPTASTSRFSSPLGVYDFQKRSSVVHASKSSANQLSQIAATIAKHENLTAHAHAAQLRYQ